MMSKESLKCYLYYLKCANNNLYAWTCVKKYAREFESTRFMGAFNKREEKFDNDDIELSIFMDTYYNQKLCEIPVTDGETNFTIIGTADEESHLDEAYQALFDEIAGLKINFRDNYPLKSKYHDVVQTLLDFGESEIDTFALFYYLFHGTFIDDPRWKVVLNNGETFLDHHNPF